MSLADEETFGPFAACFRFATEDEAVQLANASLTCMLRHLESCIGPDWRASHISFARKRPRDVSPYLKIFRAQVCFDQAENVIEFSAGVADGSWHK